MGYGDGGHFPCIADQEIVAVADHARSCVKRITTAPQKNYLVGGLVLCVFPAVVLFVLHIEDASLPMPFPILLGLLFLHGLRAVICSLFRLDLDGAMSWLVDAVSAAGFAAAAFWVAWHLKEGWKGGLPFIPANWNQNTARIVFAGGGLVAAVAAVRLLRKAVNRFRKKPDDGIRRA